MYDTHGLDIPYQKNRRYVWYFNRRPGIGVSTTINNDFVGDYDNGQRHGIKMTIILLEQLIVVNDMVYCKPNASKVYFGPAIRIKARYNKLSGTYYRQMVWSRNAIQTLTKVSRHYKNWISCSLSNVMFPTGITVRTYYNSGDMDSLVFVFIVFESA